MNAKNLMPQQAQPINRVSAGQLPQELTELSEEILQEIGYQDGSNIMPSSVRCPYCPAPFYEGTHSA